MVLFGAVVPAVFGVGLGHMTLHRLGRRSWPAELMARSALVICYGIGAFGLVLTIVFLGA